VAALNRILEEIGFFKDFIRDCTNAEPLQHFSFLLTNLSVRFAHRERVVQ
jgi:hypothetical protein